MDKIPITAHTILTQRTLGPLTLVRAKECFQVQRKKRWGYLLQDADISPLVPLTQQELNVTMNREGHEVNGIF